MSEKKVSAPFTATKNDRADTVRINEPGIICYGPGDLRGKPLPAIVIGKGGRQTLELMVASHGAWKYVTGARYWKDPDFETNDEIKANLYSWAFIDE